MTGDATVIRLQRERATAEQLIRYNDLSRLLEVLDHRGGAR